MKTKLYFLFVALFAMALGTEAKITLLEPVITDSYMAFVGENTANNYRFTLDTYEWADRGPQFQLTVEPLDAAKPAQFTTDDLSDGNYWEPMFRQYTKQMAGEEMTAQDNVKRLYVKNVALLPSQFADYEELHIISIEAGGNYTIPDLCFSGCTHLETLDCNVQGTLTLGKGIVNPQPGFTVKVYTTQNAQVWNEYKTNTGANFSVDDSEAIDANTPRILSVTLDLSVNGNKSVFALPDEGGKREETDPIVSYVLNAFTAETSGEVTELFMDYNIHPAGQTGQYEWKQIHTTDKGSGVWKYEGPAVNVLTGLENYKEYRLEFSLNTNPGDGHSDRAHYPTSGETVRIAFTTGDLSTGIATVSTTEPSSAVFDLQGRRLQENPAGKGILIRNGRKTVAK